MDLLALMRGTVVETLDRYGAVIEAQVALIEGLWGGGAESSGALRVMVEAPDEPLTVAAIDIDSARYVLVGGASIDQAALLRAAEVRVKGIIVGSIHARLTEMEAKLPYPIIVTEGFGQIPMSAVIFDLLQNYDGELTYLSGSPNGHSSGQRPEILVFPTSSGQATPIDGNTILRAGDTVRITREPYIGRMGTIKSLPEKPCVMGIRLGLAKRRSRNQRRGNCIGAHCQPGTDIVARWAPGFAKDVKINSIVMEKGDVI